MKQHTGGLSNYLNDATKQSNENINNVVEIDIDNLVPNPDNFYGMRDIDSLASLIDISKHIDPLEVKEIDDDDGKYMIMSGHRRRLAIMKLLETGKLTNRKVPCIVRKYQSSGCLTAADVEKCALIFSNKGRRDEYTLNEKIREIKELEIIVKKFYLAGKNDCKKMGSFRSYFANTLHIAETTLQRILCLEKLTNDAKNAVDNNILNETAAAELASLSEDQQNNYIELLNTNMVQGTVQEIKDIKRKNQAAEKEKNEPDMFENQNGEIDEKDVHNGHLSEQSDDASDIDNQNIPNEQIKEQTKSDNENVDSIDDNTEYLPKQNQQGLVDSNKDISANEDEEPKSNEEDNIDLDDSDPSDEPLDPLEGGEKAAKKWLIETMMPFYKDLLEDAIKKQKKAKNKHDVAVWGVRISVINLKIVDSNKTINDNR